MASIKNILFLIFNHIVAENGFVLIYNFWYFVVCRYLFEVIFISFGRRSYSNILLKFSLHQFWIQQFLSLSYGVSPCIIAPIPRPITLRVLLHQMTDRDKANWDSLVDVALLISNNWWSCIVAAYYLGKLKNCPESGNVAWGTLSKYS